jgi:lipoprotein-anchoring transpeptidase ErfK/SrfK
VASITAAQPEPVTYHLETQPRTAAELAKRFTPAQLDILEMLNRRDREHLIRPDPPTPGLVVPTEWADDPLTYSPFPPTWSAADAHPKAIVVHQPAQAFAAYELGRLVRWGPVSTGRKETPTPAGQFNLTWRARSRRSTDHQDWLLEWYFNFVNERGVSFHLFDLPGYPASHACVRLLQRDAEWLYRWGEQWTLDDSHRNVVMPGTRVLILGVYRYDAPPPWVSLEWIALPLTLPETLDARNDAAKVRTPPVHIAWAAPSWKVRAGNRELRSRMSPRDAPSPVAGRRPRDVAPRAALSRAALAPGRRQP